MPAFSATAPGKMILVGEHAVVYGRPAIAFPVTQVNARVVIEPDVKGTPGNVILDAADISFQGNMSDLPPDKGFVRLLKVFSNHFNISRLPACKIIISSTIPIASGMGSGAAVSTAMVRALAGFTGQTITEQEISQLVFEVEKVYHGNPSGIDNTVIAFHKPIYFIKGSTPELIQVTQQLTFVLTDSGIQSNTKIAVDGVRNRWEQAKTEYERYFNEIDDIVRKVRFEIEHSPITKLGELMIKNHEILKKIKVSTPQLDELVETSLSAGALGAKLIGAGLGGSVAVLVRPENAEVVADKLKHSGAKRIITSTYMP
jgi:mevalonate kinase